MFITGAAGGIGLEMTRTFAKKGDHVIVSDADENKIQLSLDILKKESIHAEGNRLDVTNENEVEDAFGQVLQKHGHIDVLINNAGLQYVSPIESFPTEKFELLIRVMLIAPFLAIKHIFPIMKKQGFGRIINIASINGLVGFAGKAAYNSAKHGVIGLTRVAALEAATHGITVNALCPGYADTPLLRNQLADLSKARNIPEEKVLEEVILSLVPQKKLITVNEIAATAFFLASDEAGSITGQAIVIDGGYTAQ